MATSLVELLAVFIFPLLSFLLISRLRHRDGRRRLPPSPPGGLPLLGHLHLLGRLPHLSLRSLAASHGPVMLLRLGRTPTVVASSAAAAEEALKTRDVAFSGRPRLLMAQRLLYGCRDVGFAPYGEYWRQARRVCALHLLSSRRVASFRRAREREVAELLGRVRARAGAGGAVNLGDLLVGYTKAVVSRAAFGDDSYGLDGDVGGDKKLGRVLADFQELLLAAPMRELAPWLGWVDTLSGLEARTRRTFQALDRLLERVIADHRSRRRHGAGPPVVGGGEVDDDHRDFVDVLLDVNEMDNKDDGLRLDTNDIKAIMLDMFVAGTDTSSTVLGWAMAELINHPREMQKLQDEIRGTAAGHHVITEDHLDGGGIPYLKAVISETMRLHAPAPLLLPHETTEDTELLGYRIPARTRVLINAWAIGRDPATWERAEEFVPQRFLDDDGSGGAPMEYGRAGHRDFKLLAFGAGRRGCPGAGFAVPVLELALANMLYHFDWELPPHGHGEMKKLLVDMSEEYGMSVPLKALVLVAKPRF